MFFFEVNQVNLQKEENGANIKIVQISDLHLKKVKFNHRMLARKVKEMSPDLLVLTGDILDRKENVHELEEFLSLFDKEMPKFAILGNWEHFINIKFEKLSKAYAKFNCKLLINETQSVTIKGKTISITGLDDYNNDRPDFAKAVRKNPPSHHHIVLQHRPAYRDILEAILKEPAYRDINVDLMIAGHTHGGQISFFGWYPYLPNGTGKYVKGYFDQYYPKLYVNKGLGTIYIPLRFQARSEVTVFNYRV
jgi:uncharacterized protein